MLATFDTGTRYAMMHALALLVVGLLAARPDISRPALRVAGWGFLVGIVVFTGSLWTLVLTGQRWLGAVTPVGGVSFLTGWLALAWSVRGWKPEP